MIEPLFIARGAYKGQKYRLAIDWQCPLGLVTTWPGWVTIFLASEDGGEVVRDVRETDLEWFS